MPLSGLSGFYNSEFSSQKISEILELDFLFYLLNAGFFILDSQ